MARTKQTCRPYKPTHREIIVALRAQAAALQRLGALLAPPLQQTTELALAPEREALVHVCIATAPPARGDSQEHVVIKQHPLQGAVEVGVVVHVGRVADFLKHVHCRMSPLLVKLAGDGLHVRER